MLLISKVDFFLSICFLKSLKLNIVGEPVDAGLLKVLNLYRYSLFVIGYWPGKESDRILCVTDYRVDA